MTFIFDFLSRFHSFLIRCREFLGFPRTSLLPRNMASVQAKQDLKLGKFCHCFLFFWNRCRSRSERTEMSPVIDRPARKVDSATPEDSHPLQEDSIQNWVPPTLPRMDLHTCLMKKARSSIRADCGSGLTTFVLCVTPTPHRCPPTCYYFLGEKNEFPFFEFPYFRVLPCTAAAKYIPWPLWPNLLVHDFLQKVSSTGLSHLSVIRTFSVTYMLREVLPWSSWKYASFVFLCLNSVLCFLFFRLHPGARIFVVSQITSTGGWIQNDLRFKSEHDVQHCS